VSQLAKKKQASLMRSLIAMTNPKSPISEQYRTIRTNIEFSQIDREIRTLMVTSTGPGEGKSTTVANLATVFAQQGKQVLLIDADLRKPTVHYTFRLQNTTGLTNVLTRQLTLKEAVFKSKIPNLYLLPSGPIPPNPAELLGSKMMKDLLDELKEEYDVVLFDTPPVLAVTDAQILANRCDGTILVVSSGKTENENALKGKELLEKANANVIGVVLNNKKLEKGNYYYYYGEK
jgi:capsular exopolysaccharide synthesis family protein